MNVPSGKMASSTLADTRKEDLVFTFSIWIQPEHMPSDSNATSSKCLFGKWGLQDLCGTELLHFLASSWVINAARRAFCRRLCPSVQEVQVSMCKWKIFYPIFHIYVVLFLVPHVPPQAGKRIWFSFCRKDLWSSSFSDWFLIIFRSIYH